MEILYLIIFFILGTVLGTIYTVIGLKLPNNEKIVVKRKCKKCHHELSIKDLIPLVSYTLSKGRCRHCKGKIDILFPYMEFFTGLLFSVAYYSFGFSYQLLIALGMISLLMTIVVSDLTYLIIPDEILIVASIYFLVIQFLDLGLKGAIRHLLSGVFLFTIMYTVMLIGNKAFKKESMGGGDIKMMFVFGLVLEPLLGTLSIFLGSFIALPISLILLRNQDEKQIPFGPFLLIALAIIYFTKLTPDAVVNFLTYK